VARNLTQDGAAVDVDTADLPADIDPDVVVAHAALRCVLAMCAR
jgi:hypothetical protein